MAFAPADCAGFYRPWQHHARSPPNKATSDSSAPIDGIVAIVNTDVITRSELNRQVATIERQIIRQGSTPPPREVLNRQVLERMVTDRAQIQRATELGIKVDDKQVEAAMEGVARQNKLSIEAFFEQLRKDGIPPERFRDEVKNELTIARLREREVDANINVSEAEIEAFLARRSNGVSVQPQVNWIQFLIKAPENASSKTLSQAEDLAAQVESGLKKGLSVEDILKANPELAIEGTGRMGWTSFDNVPTLFSEFLAKAETDAVDTVRSPNGFHVLKMLGRRQSGVSGLETAPVTQTHARHILIRAEKDITPEEAKRRLNFVREKLRQKADTFENLAKQYSMDGSASKGGDLGWLYPGDTVPEFERAMASLSTGEVSEVFESRFGFLIVQVLERREKAVSEDRQKFQARMAIRQSKSEEAYEEWVRQLRDRTFIDIRL
ncbi:MAG: molecular chaperone SurA [Limnobacter sp.]|nr:molecular chaperone SurA [Limnobacter sp.]